MGRIRGRALTPKKAIITADRLFFTSPPQHRRGNGNGRRRGQVRAKRTPPPPENRGEVTATADGACSPERSDPPPPGGEGRSSRTAVPPATRGRGDAADAHRRPPSPAPSPFVLSHLRTFVLPRPTRTPPPS